MGQDILQFLDARFHVVPDVLSAFPGGLNAGRAEPDAPRPYATMNVLAEPPSWSTEGPYTESTLVQVAVYADDLPTARRLRSLIARHPTAGLDRIAGEPLDGGDLVVTATRTGGVSTEDPDPGPAGGDLWMATLDYLFLIYRED